MDNKPSGDELKPTLNTWKVERTPLPRALKRLLPLLVLLLGILSILWFMVTGTSSDVWVRIAPSFWMLLVSSMIILSVYLLGTRRVYMVVTESRIGALQGFGVGALWGLCCLVPLYYVFYPAYPNMIGLIGLVGQLLIVVGCVLGVLMGFLFVRFKEHIPGGTIVHKSVIFTLILLAISLILEPVAMPLFGSGPSQMRLETFTNALVMYPILGCLFGYGFKRQQKLLEHVKWSRIF